MAELEKLFGSKARIKIMRLFLFNPDKAFDKKDISKKTRSRKRTVNKEMRILKKAGLVKKKKFSKTIKKKLKTKTKKVKKKVSGFTLDEKFKYLFPLRNLLIKTEPLSQKNIKEKFKKTGKIKLLLISGVLINERNARVDILVVGDDIKTKDVEKTISSLESEIGTELRYSLFDTEEFIYRTNVFDKLVREILDRPHEKLIDKIKF